MFLTSLTALTTSLNHLYPSYFRSFFKVYIPLENNFSFATTYQMFVVFCCFFFVFFFVCFFFFAITLLVYIAIITTLIKGDHLTREIILIPSKYVLSTS